MQTIRKYYDILYEFVKRQGSISDPLTSLVWCCHYRNSGLDFPFLCAFREFSVVDFEGYFVIRLFFKTISTIKKLILTDVKIF